MTATVHADAAPAETFFRYRFVDSGNWHMQPWHAAQTGRSARRGPRLTLNVGYAMSTQVQVQACSQNGCSAWVTQSFYTHCIREARTHANPLIDARQRLRGGGTAVIRSRAKRGVP